jgi:uncharacterized C2H2 Zn-finger protein
MTNETKVRCPHCGRLYDQADIESHIANAHGGGS